MDFHYNLRVAQTMSLHCGLMLAQEVVETDAKVVVDMINKVENPRSEIGLIILDVLKLIGNGSERRVCFVPRKANLVAHCLAKCGLSIERDMVWLEECPQNVTRVVLVIAHEFCISLYFLW
ncbi:hypothetical protein Ddye_030377 [Dipteronia dyeriana]|uniref:RNase H type-1 domain-containing protein n=1 Tax=Dipteronia dyeriana TaxID=168575 RepID=A0AAD9TG76_9ROSI|nr:hypothetical protein Ddye_030377 [Dipteronia dyeriana]